MSMLGRTELERMGFAALGDDVQISERASIYGSTRIRLGSHVRIDDFCVLSAGEGGIEIGNHVHIAVYTLLVGAARITLDDFAGLSSRVAVYSSSDDYSGRTMTNPTVPDKFKNVVHAEVSIGRHVIVGAGCVILPGTTLAEGVAIGALSLVRGSCEAFTIYGSGPARRLGARSRELLEVEKRLRAEQGG